MPCIIIFPIADFATFYIVQASKGVNIYTRHPFMHAFNIMRKRILKNKASLDIVSAIVLSFSADSGFKTSEMYIFINIWICSG